MGVSPPPRRAPTPATPLVVRRVEPRWAAEPEDERGVSSSRPTAPRLPASEAPDERDRSAITPRGARGSSAPPAHDTVLDMAPIEADDVFADAAALAREACGPLVNVLSYLLRHRVEAAKVDAVRATLDAFAAVVTTHRRGVASAAPFIGVVRTLTDVAARLAAVDTGDPRAEEVLRDARRRADDVLRSTLRALGDGSAHGLVRGRYRGGDDDG